MAVAEIHPGTLVDFEAISKTPSTSPVDPSSSDTTLVESPLPVHVYDTLQRSPSLSSRVTVSTFLQADGPSHPLPAAIRFPAIGARCPLPPIPYSLRTRKLAITIVWTVVVLDSVVLPIGLFFVLKYGARWSDIKNLAVSNGVFGFIAFLQYALRLWRLLRPSPTYRPLDVSRWALDFYQYQFTLGFILVTLMISFTTGPENLRLIALVPNILPAMCGPQFFVSCACYRAGLRIPFNFSSMPRGSIAPPAVFTVIEDVIAVDGGGGRVFRAAWLRRYEASEMFREMMYRLTLFWGVGCFLSVGAACAIVFSVESKYVAFGVGWAAPFVWAAVWAALTTVWVQRMMREEEDEWEERGPGGRTGVPKAPLEISSPLPRT